MILEALEHGHIRTGRGLHDRSESCSEEQLKDMMAAREVQEIFLELLFDQDASPVVPASVGGCRVKRHSTDALSKVPVFECPDNCLGHLRARSVRQLRDIEELHRSIARDPEQEVDRRSPWL